MLVGLWEENRRLTAKNHKLRRQAGGRPQEHPPMPADAPDASAEPTKPTSGDPGTDGSPR